jgi:hypothetical protein
MNATIDPIERACRAAERDFEEIALRAKPLGILAPGERHLLVDGSMFSPSWRALSGGAEVFDNELPAETYDGELDALCDSHEWPEDHHVYWDDGCLFYERVGGDDE